MESRAGHSQQAKESDQGACWAPDQRNALAGGANSARGRSARSRRQRRSLPAAWNLSERTLPSRPAPETTCS